MHMNSYPTVVLKSRDTDSTDAQSPTYPADSSLNGHPETIQIERPDTQTIALDVRVNGGYMRVAFEDETWQLILAVISTWLNA
jgi:hypothetical protein